MFFMYYVNVFAASNIVLAAILLLEYYFSVGHFNIFSHAILYQAELSTAL